MPQGDPKENPPQLLTEASSLSGFPALGVLVSRPSSSVPADFEEEGWMPALPSKRLPKTLVRHWIASHVPAAQIEEITVLASSIFEDEDKAVKWLSEANAATDDRPPIELIGEEKGFERVRNLLLRIEHGVLA